MEWTLSVKYAANFRNCSYLEEHSSKEKSLEDNRFCFIPNQDTFILITCLASGQNTDTVVLWGNLTGVNNY